VSAAFSPEGVEPDGSSGPSGGWNSITSALPTSPRASERSGTPRMIHTRPALVGRFVGLGVQVPPLDRQAVLGPKLLDVYERALPLAKQQVLQGGNGQKVVFGVHGR